MVKGINQRISTIIEHFNFNNSEFADEIDVPRSSISHLISGRNKASLDFIIKVKARFPKLSWDWLINGEGEMFVEEKPKEKEEEKGTPTLPDLFAHIDDENFGVTEKEDTILSETPSEFPIAIQSQEETKIDDSQRLEIKENENNSQTIENQVSKIIKIVWFYDNGKFESFEP
ncbi:MAG: transcriptional regulator [Flavobacteriales bacterium]|nr:MAG: transcriptional regulator [Flavobacteriales bacterium]